MTDILLKNARSTDGRLFDMAIEDGLISQLEPELEMPAKQVNDLGGRLLLPTFVNGHLHACKSNWRSLLPSGFDYSNLKARFAAIAEAKRGYSLQEVMARADTTVRQAVRHGTGAMRLFADVDADAGLRAFEALLQLRQRYTGILELQSQLFHKTACSAPRTAPPN